MALEIVTIEKSELLDLIDRVVRTAVENALRPPDELMTKDELAQYLKKSHSTVNRMMRAGLPHHGAGRPTFLRSEVNQWLREH